MTEGRCRARWDIFCRVVDNLGDAGVCWRLARQLAREHRLAVRLWIDRLTALARLDPAIDATAARQRHLGVDIRRWDQPLAADALAEGVGDVVIEAFGCDPPDDWLAAMAERSPPPVWVNLEYLSAEAWIEGCHGLPSPHPRLPLAKHFFFPGFAPRSGGLLREDGLAARRAAFGGDPAAMAAFLARLGVPAAAPDALRVSMFCYPASPLAELLAAWARGPQPVQCLVPHRQGGAALSACFGVAEPAAGALVRRGRLELCVVPFLPQDDYDRLLWACDCNFVRGEDSFVRAQWACRPFVWHIYPQSGDAHRAKLDAFLARYAADLPGSAAAALRRFWYAWNGDGGVAEAWPAFAAALPQLAAGAEPWCRRLERLGNLAGNLVRFCGNRLQ